MIDLVGIHAVVFDAVGTVIHPEPAAPVIYAEIGQRFGSHLGAPEIAGRFQTAFKKEDDWDCDHGYRTSEAREIERWRKIVAAVLDDVQDKETCFHKLFEHFAQPQAWACDPDAAFVFEELASRRYKLALASNYDRRLRSVAAGIPALRLLGTQIISSEVGWRKPAGQFFTAICRTLALPANQILYVGDDLTTDYRAATATGMKAVLFDPRETEIGVSRIATLRDLVPAD